jgi:hypothetical protein
VQYSVEELLRLLHGTVGFLVTETEKHRSEVNCDVTETYFPLRASI